MPHWADAGETSVAYSVLFQDLDESDAGTSRQRQPKSRPAVPPAALMDKVWADARSLQFPAIQHVPYTGGASLSQFQDRVYLNWDKGSAKGWRAARFAYLVDGDLYSGHAVLTFLQRAGMLGSSWKTLKRFILAHEVDSEEGRIRTIKIRPEIFKEVAEKCNFRAQVQPLIDNAESATPGTMTFSCGARGCGFKMTTEPTPLKDWARHHLLQHQSDVRAHLRKEKNYCAKYSLCPNLGCDTVLDDNWSYKDHARDCLYRH